MDDIVKDVNDGWNEDPDMSVGMQYVRCGGWHSLCPFLTPSLASREATTIFARRYIAVSA